MSDNDRSAFDVRLIVGINFIILILNNFIFLIFAPSFVIFLRIMVHRHAVRRHATCITDIRRRLEY